MLPPLKGRLGYTLHLCRGDLRSPAGEHSSPLPDDTKNVSVSQKTAGASPRDKSQKLPYLSKSEADEKSENIADYDSRSDGSREYYSA